jgi:NADPH:quinone reductase-like Zn-dependent oxidoreductase
MKAIIRTEYGSADVLRLAEIERPAPGPREVLVRVVAAGVEIGAWHVMTGSPSLARLAFGLRSPRAAGVGSELAGIVEKVGSAVTRFQAGDEVFGVGTGAFAEYAIAPEKNLAVKPASVPFADAAASAISGVTAVQAVNAAGTLPPGARVLVLGASGGVGSFILQIARAAGAHVTGAASTAKLDLVRALGADEVIDYTAVDVTDGSVTYDAIFDMGGNRSVSVLRRALTPRGALVIVGGEGAGGPLGGFERGWGAGALSPFVRQRLVGLVSLTKVADLERVGELLASGDVTPAIERSYPLAETQDAMRRLEARQVRGKVVIEVVPQGAKKITNR